MVLNILVTGLLTEHVEKDNSFMQKVMFLTESGTWIEPLDMEFINIKMELFIKVIGEMTCSMAMAMKNGLMVALT